MDNIIENRKSYYAPMHTAEHILNQTMVRKFNIERSFNNHIEKKKSKCDYYFNRNLTNEEIDDLNNRVNEIIQSDLMVYEEFIPLESAKKYFDLKKLNESENETIRLIKIGTYDTCPCSGEHVRSTKEVGLFFITTTTFDNGILRIRFKLTN